MNVSVTLPVTTWRRVMTALYREAKYLDQPGLSGREEILSADAAISAALQGRHATDDGSPLLRDMVAEILTILKEGPQAVDC